MNPQDMFMCGALMAIAATATCTTTEAKPTAPASGDVSISHIDTSGGGFQLAEKADSYIRSSKLPPHVELTKATKHHRSHHDHHPTSLRHNDRRGY